MPGCSWPTAAQRALLPRGQAQRLRSGALQPSQRALWSTELLWLLQACAQQLARSLGPMLQLWLQQEAVAQQQQQQLSLRLPVPSCWSGAATLLQAAAAVARPGLPCRPAQSWSCRAWRLQLQAPSERLLWRLPSLLALCLAPEEQEEEEEEAPLPLQPLAPLEPASCWTWMQWAALPALRLSLPLALSWPRAS